MIETIKFLESSAGQRFLEVKSELLGDMQDIGAFVGDSAAIETMKDLEANMMDIFSQEYTGCEEVQSGSFEITSNGMIYKTIRTDSTQTEFFDGKVYEYKIRWLNPCKYEIIQKRSSLAQVEKKYFVNIYEIIENGYKFIILTEMEGKEVIQKGQMIRSNP